LGGFFVYAGKGSQTANNIKEDKRILPMKEAFSN
jgi:hypothetical protein